MPNLRKRFTTKGLGRILMPWRSPRDPEAAARRVEARRNSELSRQEVAARMGRR